MVRPNRWVILTLQRQLPWRSLQTKSCRRLLYYPYKLSKTQRQRGLTSIDLSNPFAVHAIDPGRDVIQFGTNRVGMAADNPSYNRRLTTAA